MHSCSLGVQATGHTTLRSGSRTPVPYGLPCLDPCHGAPGCPLPLPLQTNTLSWTPRSPTGLMGPPLRRRWTGPSTTSRQVGTVGRVVEPWRP